MPAEWEPHAATWLTWPREKGISFPDAFGPIPDYWVTMCKLLSPHEKVHINVFDEAQEKIIRRHLTKAGLKIGSLVHRSPRPADPGYAKGYAVARASGGVRVDEGRRIFLHRFPAYEPWCRDHGPTFLVKSSKLPAASPLAILDWNYNAWGNKYPPYDLDDAVPGHIARLLNVPIFKPGIVMEGGAIDVNGRGTLLTTESCLLNKNRNPHLSKRKIEQCLKNYLGVTHVLWLGDGIEGDDTDGHVDDLTRFVNARTVVTVIEEDKSDANYERLQDNLKRLRLMKDQDGRPLRIVTLPMPGVIEREGQRLPASYANFYIANKVVLLPVYGHANDAIAQQTLQKLFPRRKVHAMDCRDLVWGLGAFHCVTQQQPASSC